MRIAVLGGDGYCGWATALYLSKQGNEVAIVDNYIRRKWDIDLGVSTLTPILTLRQRVELWNELTGKTIEVFEGDLRDYDFLAAHLRDFQPGRRRPLRRAALRAVLDDRPRARGRSRR